MLASLVGTRPNLIKMSAVHHAASELGVPHVFVNTQQHYDANLSDHILKSLQVTSGGIRMGRHVLDRAPNFAEAILELAEILEELGVNRILVYGDTNSTVLGAFTAYKMNKKIGHVEAGVRSFNYNMPEEINREVVDAISTRLYAPTEKAFDFLKSQNKESRTLLSGDVALDVYFKHSAKNLNFSESRQGLVVTLHRPSNVDDPNRFREILDNIRLVDMQVKIITHPRWLNRLQIPSFEAAKTHELFRGLDLLPPQDTLQLGALLKETSVVLTDSGGIQKDAFFTATPCVTLRSETEWPETLFDSWNVLQQDAKMIKSTVEAQVAKTRMPPNISTFGDGRASFRIIEDIMKI
jgi:UDP-N-acetylglucosamine 2-epimerase